MDPLQTPEELDDSDFETEDFDVRSRTSTQTEDDQLIAGQSARVRYSSPLLVYTDIPVDRLLFALPKTFSCQIASCEMLVNAYLKHTFSHGDKY